jgi:hypothetical protein
MVIKGLAIFAFDRKQQATSNRRSSAWINHFSNHIDSDVLPNLPGGYGLKYTQGPDAEDDEDVSVRVTPQMLYDLAEALGIRDAEPDEPVQQNILLPMPILPATYACTVCHDTLRMSRAGQVNRAWNIEPYSAYWTPVFVAECHGCRTKVYPDRFVCVQADGSEDEEEVYVPAAPVILIGRGCYGSRHLARMLSTCVTTAHLPLSTFATCWNAAGPFFDEDGEQLKLNHKHMWRLFVIHHALAFMAPGESFVIPCSIEPLDSDSDEPRDEEDNFHGLTRDEAMVKKALLLWPSVPSGHYWTYRIRNTDDHRCQKCAHLHCNFRPGEGGIRSTEDELINAHRRVQEDPTRVDTAVVIDGIEKLSHKV